MWARGCLQASPEAQLLQLVCYFQRSLALLGLAEPPVEVDEQLVATGDGDRLGDKAGSGIGIPVAQA